MPSQWTPERRAAQAERIRANKPWLKSTGPKTSEGKKRSSQNALKHGEDRQFIRDSKKLVSLNRQFRLLAEQMFINDALNRLERTK